VFEKHVYGFVIVSGALHIPKFFDPRDEITDNLDIRKKFLMEWNQIYSIKLSDLKKRLISR
jgi:hypothetical protein